MSKENVSSKAIGNAIVWSFAAEIAAKLLIPITNIILARILAPEAFGVIATINMIVSFADMLSTSGISRYVVQHEFESEEDLERNADVAFWTNTVISVGAWVVIAVFSKQLSAMVGNVGYEFPLIIASLSLPLTAFSSIQEAIFQRSFRYKALFYRRLAVSLLPFVVTIPLAFMGAGYWALIIGTLASNVLKIVMLSTAAAWKPTLYFSFEKLKTMFSFCMWMILGAFSSWLITYVDVLLVSNRMGEYYTGLYKNAQTTVSGIISIITAATTSVLFSSLSREQNNDEAFQHLLFSFQKKLSILVVPMGVGIYCFSDLITYLLLGNQWMEASHFIGIYGLSVALTCIFADFCKESCRAKGKPQTQFYAQMVYLVFLMPACYCAVSKGFDTLGFVRSAANLVFIAVYFIVMQLTIKISPLKMLWNVKEPMLCAVVMGVFGEILLRYLGGNYLIQFVYIGLCVVVYFATLYLFRPYRKEIRSTIEALAGKVLHRKGE